MFYRRHHFFDGKAELLEQHARRSRLAEAVQTDDGPFQSDVLVPAIADAGLHCHAHHTLGQHTGAIRRILPVEDMPHMADGSPVDIVLNPLGVPSRMNVGQILEVHLGLAAKGLGHKIGAMLRAQGSVKEMRGFLDQIYNSSGKSENLDELNDVEVMEMASNLTSGVPFATPVFDGAKEEEIKAMLALAGMPSSGQMTLFDGRTGEALDRKSVV